MTAMFSLPRIALSLLTATPAASASITTLTVVVEGAQGRQDVVRAAMLRDTAGQLKPDSTVRADIVALDSISGGNVTFVYTNLPAGHYALSAFHDANNGGRLDTNPAGIPIEPYGFSRDARGRFGPPAFDDVTIDVRGDQRVTIHLH